MARSTTADWQRCQEDIWGPICWRKIRHLSGWSPQIRTQSSFSATCKNVQPALDLCLSHYQSPKLLGEPPLFGLQRTCFMAKRVWNPCLLREKNKTDYSNMCKEVFTSPGKRTVKGCFAYIAVNQIYFSKAQCHKTSFTAKKHLCIQAKTCRLHIFYAIRWTK